MIEPSIVLPFTHCVMEMYREERLVIARFHDNTEAHACPHDTPAYHAHALEKTGLDDTLLYCWQHEIWHVINGEMRQRPSVVLWALAHGLSVDTPECQDEEREAQDMQRAFAFPARWAHASPAIVVST
jgi:hypothetical protein